MKKKEKQHFLADPCLIVFFIFLDLSPFFLLAFVIDDKQIGLIQELKSGESNIPVISTDMHGLWSRLHNQPKHSPQISRIVSHHSLIHPVADVLFVSSSASVDAAQKDRKGKVFEGRKLNKCKIHQRSERSLQRGRKGAKKQQSSKLQLAQNSFTFSPQRIKQRMPKKYERKN